MKALTLLTIVDRELFSRNKLQLAGRKVVILNNRQAFATEIHDERSDMTVPELLERHIWRQFG